MFYKRLIAGISLIALMVTITVPAMAHGEQTDLPIYTEDSYEIGCDQIIVKFKNDTTTVITVPVGKNADQLINEYSKRSDVKYAELDSVVTSLATPNDSLYLSYQASTFNAMSIPNAWEFTTGSASIVVAVIDGGVDFKHPDLAGKLLSTGYDVVNKDTDPSDENGHGTMVSGIIAANTNNLTGVAGATNCMILPIKVLNNLGKGFSSDIAEGIVYAVDHGADVINLSLGTTSYSQVMQDAVNYAHSAGIIVIAATGNTADAINYPAACTNAIAVGAVTNSKTYESYSCYGDALDLSAVGTGVASTTYNGTSTYATGEGTSFAAPFVSALAALALSLNADLTPDELESLMENSAVDVGAAGWDTYTGAGCINFYDTLNSIVNGTVPVDPVDPDPTTDTIAPVINLIGSANVTIEQNTVYTDAGATANDETDGDVTAKIQVVGNVNTAVPGTYSINYTVTDNAGNFSQAVRTVTVTAKAVVNTKPVITLNGSSTVSITAGTQYMDAGATVTDAEDGDLTSSIITTGNVNTALAGKYYIYYNVTDSLGLKATTVFRVVTVMAAVNTKPVITLNGTESVTVAQGASYTDAGATANDAQDGDITSKIITSGTVNTTKASTYKITYTVKDSLGLAALTVTRTVIVKANSKPVIKINGASIVTVKFGQVYTELGATATDAEDGNLTSNIIVSGTVDIKAGTYEITYAVTDSNGQTAVVKRTVKVLGDTKPVIIIKGNKSVAVNFNAVYTDGGIVATDVEDGDLTSKVVINNTVNTAKAGNYMVTYTVTDSSGNVTTATRTVTVKANAKPVVKLIGSSVLKIKLNGTYKETGAIATDAEEGNITSKIVTSGTVNTAKAGTYKITYTVSDQYGATSTLTRTITVK